MSLYHWIFFKIGLNIKLTCNKWKLQNFLPTLINPQLSIFTIYIFISFFKIVTPFFFKIQKYKSLYLKKKHRKILFYRLRKYKYKSWSSFKNKYLKKNKYTHLYNQFFLLFRFVFRIKPNFTNIQYNNFLLFYKKYRGDYLNLGLISIIYQYNYILQLYFYKIFNIPFKFKLVNITNLIPLPLLDSYATSLLPLTPHIFKFYYIEEIAELFISIFFTKNLKFLVKWMKNNIEKRPLRLFKQFIYYLNNVFLQLIWPNRKYYKLQGFYFKFKGKFLKGGGKKKTLTYICGKSSATTKSLRLNYNKFYIRTISGIIGCTVKITY